MERAVLELCDCLEDDALVRVFEHMEDTLAEGLT